LENQNKLKKSDDAPEKKKTIRKKKDDSYDKLADVDISTTVV